jgi:hypothetical protein
LIPSVGLTDFHCHGQGTSQKLILLTLTFHKRSPKALGALLEIIILMAIWVTAIGVYFGWFNTLSSIPMPPILRVKAEFIRGLGSQTELSPNRLSAERDG